MPNNNMLSTQPQFTFWNPNNSNVQPPAPSQPPPSLSPIQRQQTNIQSALVNDNHVKKTPNEEGPVETPTPPQEHNNHSAIDFQRPSASKTPIQQQQQQMLNNNDQIKDTPNSTPRSPGGCSDSSHDDDNETSMMSSPNSSMQASSPKHHLTNASVNLNNSSSLNNSSNHALSSDNNKDNSSDIFQKLLELGNEPERKTFVERLQTVWEEYNIQCRNLPNLSKQTLDLFKLYSLVRDRGGFNETSRLKLWKEISATLNISNSANSAFIVKKKFMQFGIFHYECKYDLNGADPIPLIIEIERNSKSNKIMQANKSGKKLLN